jgi:serine phosphatase RsbU (regulator of sigma subunit)
VTLVYFLADRERGELVMANAGHLPPLLIAGADAGWLTLPASLPLGVGPDTRQAVTIPFPPGATVLVFTDGLVERRDEDIDVGLSRLREHARALPVAPLAVQLDSIVESMRDPRLSDGGSDDVTVLGLRRFD